MNIYENQNKNRIDIESSEDFHFDNDELSVHSSDDELDDYIIAKPHIIERNKYTSKIMCKEKELDDNIPKEESDSFYMELFETAYINLGIDIIGKDVRKINLIKNKKNRFFMLKKRNLEMFNENIKKDKFLFKPNKKVNSNFNFFQNKKKINNKVQTINQSNSSWMEEIFDDLSEMNKRLFRKLQKEYELASKSSQIFFCKTLSMLLYHFKCYYYDYSLELKQNLQIFIQFIGDFFEKNKQFTNSLNKPKPLYHSLDIE